MIDAIMCSYLSPPKWMGWVKTVTPGKCQFYGFIVYIITYIGY